MLGLLITLIALSTIYNIILGLQANLNDTAATMNYQLTFDPPIPDQIHSQDGIIAYDRDIPINKVQFLNNGKTITPNIVTTPWDSSRCAVLGLATGISFNIFERKCH